MTLGIHSKLDGFDKDLIPAIIGARPTIFVGVSNPGSYGIMDTLHSALGENCRFVFRHIELDKETGGKWTQMKPGTKAKDAALIWFNDIVALGANAHPYMYWQGFNETRVDAWQGEFDAERVRLCKQRGLRCVAGIPAMGNPEPGDWQTYLPALQELDEAGENVAFLGIHVYWPKASDPNYGFPDYLGRDQYLDITLEANGLTNVAYHFLEFGANTNGYRAAGLTNEEYIPIVKQADTHKPKVRKAVYDCSAIPDDRTGSPDFSIQIPFGPRGQQTRGIDLLLPVIKAQAAPIEVPAPPPVTPPANTGDRTITVAAEVNIRALPSMSSAKLGTLLPGALKYTVTGPVTNGYVREKTYGWWILAANLKGV